MNSPLAEEEDIIQEEETFYKGKTKDKSSIGFKSWERMMPTEEEGEEETVRPTTMGEIPSPTSLCQEIWMSSELLFKNKLSWLLVLGPIALLGDATGMLGEAACFSLSGIALIPCAERYVSSIFDFFFGIFHSTGLH